MGAFDNVEDRRDRGALLLLASKLGTFPTKRVLNLAVKLSRPKIFFRGPTCI